MRAWWKFYFVTIVSALVIAGSQTLGLGQNASSAPMLKTALHHPMQYYVSLPEGWTRDKKWPIVVTITGGLKNFQANAETFAAARKNLPFIIVTPVNLTNGGSDLRHAREYSYAPAVWDEVDKTSWCDFDAKGLDAVIEDVRQQYNGEAKYFIAGHSAGGHLVWMMVLMHPEKLAAAATTGGNFTNRCIGTISSAPERVSLPVKGFRGDQEGEPATSPDKEQFFTAKRSPTLMGLPICGTN
jgi:poly(3-hydroxybutyrate) depolymerase